jgi:hypothetical protein
LVPRQIKDAVSALVLLAVLIGVDLSEDCEVDSEQLLVPS